MNQNNDFNQFGFDHYAQPPSRRSTAEKLLGPTIGQKLRSPLFATAALLLAGVAFAGVIIASYPDEKSGADVPVVKADTFAYKETPEEPGGMEIANQDSTVFSSMTVQGEGAGVENLLADEDGQQKFEEFARQVEEAVEEEQITTAARVDAAAEPDIEPSSGEGATEAEAIALQKIVQKPAEPEVEQLAAAEATKPRIHKAGKSPETLEFVRNVLDKKDAKEILAAEPTNDTTASVAANDEAAQVSSIAPAAGMSGMAFEPGSTYVQVGSVKSATGAEGEWGKIQAKFSALDGAPHRVTTADLGERGTFYRIQAGPMSTESANSLCDAIKAQDPQGCLIVK